MTDSTQCDCAQERNTFDFRQGTVQCVARQGEGTTNEAIMNDGTNTNNPDHPASPEVGPWPVDVDRMNKGDDISVEEMEKLTGLNRYHHKFNLESLRIKDQVLAAALAKGKEWMIVSRRGSLHILTDQEAVDLIPTRADEYLRKYSGTIRDMARKVEPDKLTPSQREARDRFIRVEALRAQAAGLTRQVAKHLRTDAGEAAASMTRMLMHKVSSAGEAVSGESAPGMVG